MNRLKIISGLLIVFCFSCVKELNIKSQSSVHKIVLNSVFNPNSIFKVELSPSFSPYEDIEVKEIKDATVSIYEEGILKENLVYQTSTDKHLGKYISSFVPIQGKNYRIKASSPNYDDVAATAKIPSLVTFKEAKAINDKLWTSNNPGLIRHDFSFVLDDNPEENYYYLTISAPINKFNPQTLEWELYAHQYAEILIADLPKAQLYVNNGLIFTDRSFNGNSFKIKGTATSYREIHEEFDGISGLVKDTSILEVSLHHLSKEVYYFYTSHATNLLNQDDFYTEPTSVYSNIKNGFGIFGGEAIDEQEMVIQY